MSKRSYFVFYESKSRAIARLCASKQDAERWYNKIAAFVGTRKGTPTIFGLSGAKVQCVEMSDGLVLLSSQKVTA